MQATRPHPLSCGMFPCVADAQRVTRAGIGVVMRTVMRCVTFDRGGVIAHATDQEDQHEHSA